MNFRYPNINGGTVQERLAQIERHLYGLTNDLNYAVGGLVSAQASAGGGSGGGGGGNLLQPGAVTTNIIADGAVTNAKIADGAIDKSKLSFSTDLIAGSGISVEGRKISTAAAPYNILDNSYFLNPVNQDGISSVTSPAWTRIIDRWRAFSQSGTITLRADGILVSGDFSQPISIADSAKYNGKMLTFAAKIGGNVYCVSFHVNLDGSYHEDSVATPYGRIYIVVGSAKDLAVLIRNNTGSAVVEWAALYEGAYTTDTIPAYQPKGYAVERAECLRYRERVRVIGVISKGSYDGSVFRFGVNYSEKRVIPTISIVEFWSPGWYGQSDMGNVTVQVEDKFRAAICTDKAATAGLIAYCTVWVNADL